MRCSPSGASRRLSASASSAATVRGSWRPGGCGQEGRGGVRRLVGAFVLWRDGRRRIGLRRAPPAEGRASGAGEVALQGQTLRLRPGGRGLAPGDAAQNSQGVEAVAEGQAPFSGPRPAPAPPSPSPSPSGDDQAVEEGQGVLVDHPLVRLRGGWGLPGEGVAAGEGAGVVHRVAGGVEGHQEEGGQVEARRRAPAEPPAGEGRPHPLSWRDVGGLPPDGLQGATRGLRVPGAPGQEATLGGEVGEVVGGPEGALQERGPGGRAGQEGPPGPAQALGDAQGVVQLGGAEVPRGVEAGPPADEPFPAPCLGRWRRGGIRGQGRLGAGQAGHPASHYTEDQRSGRASGGSGGSEGSEGSEGAQSRKAWIRRASAS